MTTHSGPDELVQPSAPTRLIPPVHGLYQGPTRELVAEVLVYAARGWHVFPLLPGSKKPATPTHRAAHCYRTDPWCRNGHTGWQDRATTNPQRITRAWTTPATTTDVARPGGQRNGSWRPFGVGIATGPSRLLVIDTDVPKLDDPVPAAWVGQGVDHGDDVLVALADEHHGHLPSTWTVTTPSGGRHRYYQAPALAGGVQLGNSAGLLGWLIDTRGQGGYVAAPPTQLDTGPDGGAYELVEDRPPAPLPAWIVSLLARTPRPRPEPAHGPHSALSGSGAPTRGNRSNRDLDALTIAYVNAAVTGETTRVRTAPAGRRNHTLFVAAVALGQLVAGHALDEHTARAALLAACEVHLAAGAFIPPDAEATITSGLTRGAREPRTPYGRTA